MAQQVLVAGGSPRGGIDGGVHVWAQVWVDGAGRDFLTILALNAKSDLFSSLWAGGPQQELGL